MTRFGIFSRLTVGYIITFILLVTSNIYAISQLHKLNISSHDILETNNRTIDYEKKLSDSLFSQIRYEKKYIILKDDVLYKQFMSANDDFIRYLDEVRFISEIPHLADLLISIKQYHNQYRSLFDEEVGFIREHQSYAEDLYKEKKDENIDGIMVNLRTLKSNSQEYTDNRIAELGTLGTDAQRAAISITLVGLFWGITISFLITRSITKPLSSMVKKTKEISEGVYKGDLQVSTLPEIDMLTTAFNSMCIKLSMVDKMKSDFFAMMSHELRTPLTSIKEGTSLLLEGIGGEVANRQKRLLTIIYEESHRLIDLVNSLLDLSKMEAGMMVFHYTRGDIAPLINKAVTELEPMAIARGIAIKVENISNLSAIKFDIERILQVLRNLIGNAIKFTPNGGTVFVSADEINGNLEISVRDTGPGIPNKDLKTIFEKFHQIQQTGSHQLKGTGLGLTIVKSIVCEHGGDVWAISEPEQGSTFVFSLPVCSSSQ